MGVLEGFLEKPGFPNRIIRRRRVRNAWRSGKSRTLVMSAATRHCLPRQNATVSHVQLQRSPSIHLTAFIMPYDLSKPGYPSQSCFHSQRDKFYTNSHVRELVELDGPGGTVRIDAGNEVLRSLVEPTCLARMGIRAPRSRRFGEMILNLYFSDHVFVFEEILRENMMLRHDKTRQT